MEKNNELIKNFIVENFLFGNAEGLKDDTSFLEEGIIDSTGVLELITFIEDEYSIQVDEEEMIPDNLDSIGKIVQYIERKAKKSNAA